MIARTSKIVLEVAAASLIGLILLAVAAGWRLTQGPVSLGFLTTEIEEALNSRGAPVRIRIDNTILTWAGSDRPLDVRIVGVRAMGADGGVIASVPEMSVRFSARALMRRVIAPTSLELLGPRLHLARSADGEIQLAVGDSGTGSSNAIEGLVAAIAAPRDADSPMGYLNRVSVLGAELTIDDRMTGTVWGAPRADVVLLRGDEGLHAEFGLDLDIGGGVARVDGTARWQPGTDRIDVAANFAGLRPDRLAAKLPILAEAAALRLPLDGELALGLRVDGRLETARFSVSGSDGRLEFAEFWPDGLKLKKLEAKGRYEAAPVRFAIESFAVDLDGPALTAHGSAVAIDDRMAIDGGATVHNLPLSDLGRYWPEKIGPKARRWVIANLSRGKMEEARVDVSLRAGGSAGSAAVEALSGTLRVSGATVRYLEGMPPVQRVDATGTFTDDRMVFNLRKGEMDGLAIDGGTVRLTGLDGDNERAAVEAVVRGPVAKVLAVIDRPRLGYAKAIGVVPAAAAGEAAVRLAVSLPLNSNVTFDEVEIAAAANLRGVGLPAIVYGQDLSDGALTLRVDKRAMSIEGTATIGPAPVSLKWHEQFGPVQGYVRRYEVKGTFDDAAREAFGFDFPPYLQGPVGFDLTLGQRQGGAGEASVRLALENATLNIPPLGWSKPPGVDGHGFLTLALDKTRLTAIPELSVITRELLASTALHFDPGGRLAAVDIKRFRLGASDAHGRVLVRADGGYDVDLKGPGFDAAPLLRGGDEDGSATPPLTIAAAFDRLWFSTGQPIEKASGRLTYDGKLWREVSIVGALSEKQSMQLRISTAGTTRTASFEAGDAGAALRALDISETVTGGRLLLAMTRDASSDDTPWRGSLAMRDINIAGAPVLARLLSLASLTGIVNALSGKGIAFARVDVPVVLKDGVARTENARAVGSELGLTANGEIDLKADRIKLEGTIVPAYTINSVLGNIPILGQIFTGDKGSGVFAATYRIDGRPGEPEVRVNPLAALAPGFLRNLFDIFDGGDTRSDEKRDRSPAAAPATPVPESAPPE